MSKIEIDLQNLSTLETEIKILERRRSGLESDLESLTKECNALKSDTDKEIAFKRQQAETQTQEIINEANSLLEEAKKKLNLIQQREKDSEAIEQLQKNLHEEAKGFIEERKQIDTLKSSLSEKERKAELLIEQYTKRLDEISGAKKETKEEKPKTKKK